MCNPTILRRAGIEPDAQDEALPVRMLADIAKSPCDPERRAFAGNQAAD